MSETLRIFDGSGRNCQVRNRHRLVP